MLLPGNDILDHIGVLILGCILFHNMLGAEIA